MTKEPSSLTEGQVDLLASKPMNRAACRKKLDLLLRFMDCKEPSLLASAERTIRWEYVTDLIMGRRKERDHTVVQVARALKMATYKIVEVEKGRIDPRMYPVLRTYLRFLDLETEYLEWEAMNRDLVEGCEDAPPKRRRAAAPKKDEGSKT